jgi:hypothetical protein
MSACPPRPPRQRYCSAITKRERPRRDRSAPATRDLQDPPLRPPRRRRLPGVIRRASTTRRRAEVTGRPVRAVGWDDKRSSASSSAADSPFAPGKRQPRSRAPRQSRIASMPTHDLSALARNRRSGKHRAASAIAQEQASGSRPATGRRWPRGAPRRDKRRLPLSTNKQHPHHHRIRRGTLPLRSRRSSGPQLPAPRAGVSHKGTFMRHLLFAVATDLHRGLQDLVSLSISCADPAAVLQRQHANDDLSAHCLWSGRSDLDRLARCSEQADRIEREFATADEPLA